ncbi:MAG: hypothetical protein AUI52_04145 [Acidobacteria bacterium 13_1_40CM_2_68_10]|nr:MAG: hypothetical protein AUI52_04145 [Acidobacteria bacterium 13_1_40CM_2_68_10]
MSHGSASPFPSRRPARILRLAGVLAVLAAAAFSSASADTNSARYKFEGNKWLALDLAVGDVRAETIRFEWPATLMRMKTGYKATVKIANGSSQQVRVGIAIALIDKDLKLIGAGTVGTTLGTIDPGTSAQFTVDFKDVTARLEQADQFYIALETR